MLFCFFLCKKRHNKLKLSLGERGYCVTSKLHAYMYLCKARKRLYNLKQKRFLSRSLTHVCLELDKTHKGASGGDRETT